MIIYTLRNIDISNALSCRDICFYEVDNFLMLYNVHANVRVHFEMLKIPYIIEHCMQTTWVGFNENTHWTNVKTDYPIHNPMELVDWFEEQEHLYQIYKLDNLL